MSTSMEMPKYNCDKQVWALKIDSLIMKAGFVTGFIPENEDFGPIDLSDEYIKKHDPKSGGYYVVYKDGYKSFSPAEAFEEGYSIA